VIALFRSQRHRGRVTARTAFALLAMSSTVFVACSAPELPELRYGLWELKGTSGGKDIDNQSCVNPVELVKAEHATLKASGCKVSDFTRSGNAYRYTSNCEMQTRKGRTMKSDLTSVMKVEGDSGFTLEVRGTTNNQPVNEVIVGKRIGDCDSAGDRADAPDGSRQQER
jgi:hypothetical protein